MRRLTLALLLAALPVAAQPLAALAQDAITRCGSLMPRDGLDACAEAMREAEHDPRLLARLAEALFHADRVLESFAAYRAALRQTPDNAKLHYQFAGRLVLSNEFEEGVRAAETALRLDPQMLPAWSLLATSYRYMKQPDKALAATRRAAELGDANEAYALGLAYRTGSDGLPHDAAAGQHWLGRAAAAGHEAARQELLR